MPSVSVPTRSSGVVAALISAAAFGLSGTIVTPMLTAGWSPAAAVVVRLSIGALALAPWAVISMKGHWTRWRSMLGTIAVYGALAVAGVQFAYFQAVSTIPVAVALLLEYLGLVLVLVWLRVRRHQKVAWPAWMGAGVALTGMVLVLQLDRIDQLDLRGVSWGLAAAVGLAAYFILADSPRTDADNAVTHTGEPVPPPVLAAGGLGLGALGLLALCAVGVLPWTTSTLRLDYGGLTVPWWTAALALGGVSGAVAYASGILAVRRLGPRLAAFLALIEVLLAPATAALVLGQALAPIQWIGAVVVIVGIIIIRRTQ